MNFNIWQLYTVQYIIDGFKNQNNRKYWTYLVQPLRKSQLTNVRSRSVEAGRNITIFLPTFVCYSQDAAATLLRVVSPGGRPTRLDGEGSSNGRLETSASCLDELEDLRTES